METATLYVLLMVFFASLIRSSLGFGEGLIAVPLLVILVPLEIAAPVVVLLSITIAVVVVQDWREIQVIRNEGSALQLCGPTNSRFF
jgi:uncharacterized protein